MLSAALEGVSDVATACRTAVDALREGGFELTSVYLESGDRLRCLGVHGYGQLYDGIPPGVGVIGTTFASGRAAHVSAHSQNVYRPAAAEVAEELSLPLTVDGRCIGVLNIESHDPLPAAAQQALAHAARQLSDCLQRLGGPPPESRAQRLVRVATTLADATTLTELTDVLLDAAMTLSEMSSACLIAGPTPAVVAARGQAATALTELGADDLQGLLPWIGEGGSSRTSGQPGALASPAQRLLARQGLNTFLLVPLSAGSESLGVLLTGDPRRLIVEPTTVESVELLAALAAADIRSLRATDRLRHRARTDPLTGLPHRGAFTEALELSVLRDRTTSRGQLAVLVLDLDDFKAVNDTHGHQAGDALLRQIAVALSAALRSTDVLYRLGGDEFAVLLDLDDIAELPAIVDRLLDAARQAGITVSIGGCILQDGESIEHTMAAADARLYLAKRDGRDRAALPI